ncbi:AI-2E family transporter [uncultured Rikenella sp.]|uniref:AI-2E family transporter n=1 Tax=uncultured Rikenella sp. TaxID=368003 RepID=UPI0025D39FC1|nr:AI-2E family transporter [uncultured Rikenella sp.]
MSDLLTRQNAVFRRLLFLGALIALGIIIFRQLSFFTGAFLGAVTLYAVLRQPLFRLTEERRWRPWIASVTLVTITCILLLSVGYLIFEVIATEIPDLKTAQIIAGINRSIEHINDWAGYRIISGRWLAESEVFIQRFASMLINTTYSFTANILMTVVILYFMLSAGRRMEAVLIRYLPFSGQGEVLLRREAKTMIFSNAVGIPVILLAQMVTSGLLYWATGIPSALFWAFLTAVCGLIPMVGTALVSVPLGIYLLATGAVWPGIFLLAGAALLIANVDNVCRIFLMKRAADTHPLIVVFGVIAGIPLFGFWGIIFGPLLLSGFLLLIRIYYVEYRLLPSPPPDTSADTETPPKE